MEIHETFDSGVAWNNVEWHGIRCPGIASNSMESLEIPFPGISWNIVEYHVENLPGIAQIARNNEELHAIAWNSRELFFHD